MIAIVMSRHSIGSSVSTDRPADASSRPRRVDGSLDHTRMICTSYSPKPSIRVGYLNAANAGRQYLEPYDFCRTGEAQSSYVTERHKPVLWFTYSQKLMTS